MILDGLSYVVVINNPLKYTWFISHSCFKSSVRWKGTVFHMTPILELKYWYALHYGNRKGQ